MHKIGFLVLTATVLAGPAFAQATRDDAGSGPSPTRSSHAGRPRSGSSERPLDRGPFTPEASRAYNGGGMVLESAPGGPPPVPQPTAPPVMPQGR